MLTGEAVCAKRSVPPNFGCGVAALVDVDADVVLVVAAGALVGAAPDALVGGAADALVGAAAAGALLGATPHAVASTSPAPEASARNATRRLTFRSFPSPGETPLTPDIGSRPHSYTIYYIALARG